MSPDSHRQFAVERFGEFYRNGYSIDDYLDALPESTAGSNGNF